MELTERHHKVWSLRLNLTQRAKTYPDNTLLIERCVWAGFADVKLTICRNSELKRLTDAESDSAIAIFLDLVNSGAWPILVRGVTCQVNSDKRTRLTPF